MATLTEEIQSIKTASQAQTAASQALAAEVAGKMGQIDNKVDTSIQQVESTYEGKASALTIIATDGYRKAVEHNSGGRNTVVYDEQGNPNIMVVVPRFNYEDLNLPELELGTGTPTAFLTNGAPRGEILVGKYLASNAPGGSAVIGGVDPRTGVNYDVAKELCTRKGAGWHLMSMHEWAAIALFSLANNTVPRGNTNYGRAHDNNLETAIRYDKGVPGDTDGTGRTRTGGGPATWSHDHTEFGIMDLVGNVYEWVDQMKLQDGRIITTLDNNPGLAEASWTQHPAYYDATAETGGEPKLDTKVNIRQGEIGNSENAGASNSVTFASLSKASGYAGTPLLRQLLLETATANTVTGRLYTRNFGERFPLRGGSWGSGANAGLGTVSLSHSRVIASSSLGFRPALFV